METIYLVDGSGYIFRAYYAVAPLSTSSGMPTNALLGFTRMILKLLKDKKANNIAVAFDMGKPTFRHELYSEYKANRIECPEDLKTQMPYFRKIVQALGLACVEKEGFEADDIIATIAQKLATDETPVMIVSGDKDLTQLVNKNIIVWDAMRDITYDEWAVKEKFGVNPEQIRDYLAIVGDSSDNVPGIKGLGPKAAQRLLEEYGNIEKLLENIKQVQTLSGLRGAKGIQEKIESSIEILRLSQQLVSLDNQVTPFSEITDHNQLSWSGPKSDELEALFTELEFNSMIESAHRVSNGRGLKELAKSKNYNLAPNLTELAEKLSAAKSFAFDTETSSLDPISAELIGASFSVKDDEAYFVGFASHDPNAKLVSLEEFKKIFSPIFANPEIKKSGSNLKFDIEVLKAKGVEVKGVEFDSLLAAHILNPDRRDYGLKSLALKLLGEHMVSYKELAGEAESLLEVPYDRLANYACHDADAALKVSKKLQLLLSKPGNENLNRVFAEIEMPLVEVLADMELAGIKIDAEYLAALSEELGMELGVLTTKIQALAGEEFNLNSPKQLGEVLFEKMKIPSKGVKKTQLGFSTNSAVLEKLLPEHEIIALILEYRELHKLKSTYVDALPPMINPITGRIHANFNQAIAATGRLSSNDPNLQNIPIKNARGRKIREAFKAKEGSQFIIADYSQIELRILAHLSEDAALSKAFVDGEDIHSRTAHELFGADLFSDQKELRRIAKTINFGIIYGMGAFRLSKELEIPRNKAQEYIDQYFARYPKVQQYFDALRKQIETLGYVETLFGRRRFKNDIDAAGRDPSYAERALLNAPLQGSASEIIKKAMINLHQVLAKFGQDARIVSQVHDELIIEASENLLDQVYPLVISAMENAVELNVPLKVEARVRYNWGGQ